MTGVTGANGLLGSFIIRKLIEEGEPFVAFKRANSDISLLEDVKDRIKWRDLDVLDPVMIEEALEGISAVVHTAAMVSFNPRHASAVSNANTAGT